MEQHVPVLLKETIHSLDIKDENVVVDVTLGLGGHAEKILQQFSSGIFVGVDQDSNALDRSRRHLTNIPAGIKTHFVEGNFKDIKEILSSLSIEKVDRMFADLGWGAHHLESGRGFSFMKDEPLNMCYSTKEDGCVFDAFYVVNEFDPENLYEIIYNYGEERWAKRITSFIVEARSKKPIETTKELADIISGAVPRKLQPRKIHVATKTFQAIRIVVNNEIAHLQDFLNISKTLVTNEGRLSIITFHSLEARIVKNAFKVWETENIGKRLNKKAMKATKEEIQQNPRSRSAQLRTFVFNNNI